MRRRTRPRVSHRGRTLAPPPSVMTERSLRRALRSVKCSVRLACWLCLLERTDAYVSVSAESKKKAVGVWSLIKSALSKRQTKASSSVSLTFRLFVYLYVL